MRRFPPLPVSQRAVWARRIAYFGLAVVIAGLFLLRYRPVPLNGGFAVLAAGFGIVLVAALAALWAFAQIWRTGARGAPAAWRGLIVALCVLAWPAIIAVAARQVPGINDISTDLEDPPAFGRARAAMLARDNYSPGSSSPETRAAQAAFYTDVKSLVLEIKPEDAYRIARAAALKLGWRIVDEQPPAARSAGARFEALDRTFLLRFPDDIAVRLRATAAGTRLDIRSVSRLGRSDFGVNAKRIRAFLAEAASQAADL